MEIKWKKRTLILFSNRYLLSMDVNLLSDNDKYIFECSRNIYTDKVSYFSFTNKTNDENFLTIDEYEDIHNELEDHELNRLKQAECDKYAFDVYFYDPEFLLDVLEELKFHAHFCVDNGMSDMNEKYEILTPGLFHSLSRQEKLEYIAFAD